MKLPVHSLALGIACITGTFAATVVSIDHGWLNTGQATAATTTSPAVAAVNQPSSHRPHPVQHAASRHPGLLPRSQHVTVMTPPDTVTMISPWHHLPPPSLAAPVSVTTGSALSSGLVTGVATGVGVAATLAIIDNMHDDHHHDDHHDDGHHDDHHHDDGHHDDHHHHDDGHHDDGHHDDGHHDDGHHDDGHHDDGHHDDGHHDDGHHDDDHHDDGHHDDGHHNGHPHNDSISTTQHHYTATPVQPSPRYHSQLKMRPGLTPQPAVPLSHGHLLTRQPVLRPLRLRS